MLKFYRRHFIDAGAQVAEPAPACCNPGASFSEDENIPESDLLDSAAIIELINSVEKKTA